MIAPDSNHGLSFGMQPVFVVLMTDVSRYAPYAVMAALFSGVVSEETTASLTLRFVKGGHHFEDVVVDLVAQLGVFVVVCVSKDKFTEE